MLLINSERITPIKLDSNLSNIATKRAEIVYKKGFSHNNWTDSFKGTDCFYIGENLAQDFTDSKSMHKAFMQSPSHKRNIQNTNYKTIGIGTYKNTTVELFCGKF